MSSSRSAASPSIAPPAAPSRARPLGLRQKAAAAHLPRLLAGAAARTHDAAGVWRKHADATQGGDEHPAALPQHLGQLAGARVVAERGVVFLPLDRPADPGAAGIPRARHHLHDGSPAPLGHGVAAGRPPTRNNRCATGSPAWVSNSSRAPCWSMPATAGRASLPSPWRPSRAVSR